MWLVKKKACSIGFLGLIGSMSDGLANYDLEASISS
jgi:hypothetical protein